MPPRDTSTKAAPPISGKRTLQRLRREAGLPQRQGLRCGARHPRVHLLALRAPARGPGHGRAALGGMGHRRPPRLLHRPRRRPRGHRTPPTSTPSSPATTPSPAPAAPSWTATSTSWSSPRQTAPVPRGGGDRMGIEIESRDRRPEEPDHTEGRRALDASQELFCRDIAARVPPLGRGGPAPSAEGGVSHGQGHRRGHHRPAREGQAQEQVPQVAAARPRGLDPRTGKYKTRTRRVSDMNYTQAKKALRDFIEEIEDDKVWKRTGTTFEECAADFMDRREQSGEFTQKPTSATGSSSRRSRATSGRPTWRASPPR